jgi:hypothetical protein
LTPAAGTKPRNALVHIGMQRMHFTAQIFARPSEFISFTKHHQQTKLTSAAPLSIFARRYFIVFLLAQAFTSLHSIYFISINKEL